MIGSIYCCKLYVLLVSTNRYNINIILKYPSKFVEAFVGSIHVSVKRKYEKMTHISICAGHVSWAPPSILQSKSPKVWECLRLKQQLYPMGKDHQYHWYQSISMCWLNLFPIIRYCHISISYHMGLSDHPFAINRVIPCWKTPTWVEATTIQSCLLNHLLNHYYQHLLAKASITVYNPFVTINWVW